MRTRSLVVTASALFIGFVIGIVAHDSIMPRKAYSAHIGGGFAADEFAEQLIDVERIHTRPELIDDALQLSAIIQRAAQRAHDTGKWYVHKNVSIFVYADEAAIRSWIAERSAGAPSDAATHAIAYAESNDQGVREVWGVTVTGTKWDSIRQSQWEADIPTWLTDLPR